MIQTILFSLSLFYCHFLADFTPLSSAWMQNAKRFGTPFFPIFVHACVHGFLMYIVMKIFNVQNAEELAIFQISSHFLIDVLKGKLNVKFPALLSNNNAWHWIVFGMDQFFHNTVIVLMIQFAQFG